jgi:P-aminobenzoate N-oxygenase AurF
MYHDFNYEATLASSLRAAWKLDDVLAEDQNLDFTRNFMPDGLARTSELDMLQPAEQRLLNQIAGNTYLHIFGVVEEFILPFLLDHARTTLDDDDYRIRALLNFAGEEAKHIHLFKRFAAAFKRGFPVDCALIGPSEAIGAEVLKHDPLAVAIVILMIEWVTQSHYLHMIRDDGDLDPLFKSLLKHHWMEEAQHAKLDTLIVEALAEGKSEAELEAAMDDFFAIGAFLDGGLAQQVGFNLDALEAVTGRKLENRQLVHEQQHQAARWTFIGSGMVHERFREILGSISPAALARIDEAAPTFA